MNTFLPINKNHSIKLIINSTSHSMVFLSKLTFYFFSIRYTGGKKAAQEVAKVVTKTTLPPEISSASSMKPFNNPPAPTDFPKPPSTPPTTAPEGLEKPDLRNNFTKPTTVKFLGQPPKNTNEKSSSEHQYAKNLDYDESPEILETKSLIGVYTEEKIIVINNNGQRQELKEEIHAMLAQEQQNGSLQLLGAFTSSAGNTKTSQKNNVKLSPVKYNGDFTPIPNKKSTMDDYGFELPTHIKEKQTAPVVNDRGEHVPHPTKGGQYLRRYPEIINISPEERSNLELLEDKRATKYIQEDTLVAAKLMQEVKHAKAKNQHVVGFSGKTIDALNEQENNDTQSQNKDSNEVINAYEQLSDERIPDEVD
jgi:hypothetical protein